MSATSPSPASATTAPPPPSSFKSNAPQSSPSTTTSPSQPSFPPPDTSTSPPPASPTSSKPPTPSSLSPPPLPNANPPASPTSSKPPTPSSQSPLPATPPVPPPSSPPVPPPSPPPPPPPPSRPPQASPASPPLPSEAVSPVSPPPPPPRSNSPPPSSPLLPPRPRPRPPPPPPPPVVPPKSSPPPINSSPPPPSNQPAPSPPTSPANNSTPPSTPSPLQNSPPPTPAAVPPSRNSSSPSSAARPSKNSPPPIPSAAPPPENSPPTPSAAPPQRNSPPLPTSVPSPRNSSPSRAAVSPESSPPPPVSASPRNPPPPPQSKPTSSPPPPSPRKVLPPPASQPTPSHSKIISKSKPPSPAIRLAPPPSSRSLFPPSSSQSPATTAAESSNLSGNTDGGIGTGGIVAISVVVGILVIAIIGIAIWCMRRQKKWPPSNGGYVMPATPDSPSASDSSFFKTPSSAPHVQSGSASDSLYTPSEPSGLGNSRSWFTYEELVKATNGFSDQNLLGKGGFGSVYKGCLPDGREVAVKQLKIGGGQGEREFKAEVETISRIHHRHLISMVGYCIQDSKRLLVYDYAPNDTLYFHLHGEGRPVLDWTKRVRIAAGAARGLAYLHEDCNPRIIHRDIKSSNILLDYNFEARVSDFGLARLALDANTHVTTRVMGTFGYLAPEYASSGKLTEKSDVYSFGVVLLELITGRKPVDTSQPLGEESLVEWARPLLCHALENDEFDNLTDPRLEKNYVQSEFFCMVEVAAACVRHSATKRPNMGQVVRAFDSLVTSDLTNGMRPGESEAFDSARESEEIELFRRMAFGFQDYSTEFFSPRVHERSLYIPES